VKRLAIVALFLVAACGSISTAQAHTISLAYKAGDAYKYTLHAVLDYTIGAAAFSIPFKVDMSAKEAVKVKSVDSSGTADMSIDLTDLSLKTTANGVTNTTTATNPTTIEMKVASDGHIVSVNGSVMGPNSLPGLSGTQGGIVSAILPDNAVKPGDTWTKNYDQTNPKGTTGALHVTTNNKYLRDEQTGGVSAAVIESKINANLDLTLDLSALAGQGSSPLIPATGSGGGLQSIAVKGSTATDVTSWIDSGAHRIIKSHSTGNIDATLTLNMAPGSPSTGLSGPITIKGTQTLDMNPA
jgi:hypothetical protein